MFLVNILNQKKTKKRKRQKLLYDYCKILFHSMDLEITQWVVESRLVNGPGASQQHQVFLHMGTNFCL